MRITPRASERDDSEANIEVRERIADAARRCFARFGIKKTTIEDIAAEAEMSRGSIYRYFANKDDILRNVSTCEVLRVNQEIRKRLPRVKDYRELLTEALLLATIVGRENNYVRMFMESIEYASKSADPSTEEYIETSAVWAPLIESAMAKGIFADDLSKMDVASWLILSESLLFIKAEAGKFTEDELRSFIRRFVVMPLFNRDTSGPA